MLDTINAIIKFLQDYPFIFFGFVGYFNGYLFRNVNFIKVIAIILILPYCLSLLIEINLVFSATLPFCIFALGGFLGIDKSKYYLSKIANNIQNRLRR